MSLHWSWRLLSNQIKRNQIKRSVLVVCNSLSSITDEAVGNTVNNLAVDLERHSIDYAIMGGNALQVHGFKRFTTDVDVLLEKGGKEVFAEKLVGRGYVPRFAKSKSKFKNTIYNVDIDLLESGDYPGDGKPKEICFPDPKEQSFELVGPGVRVKYLDLRAIIELKLASYQSLPDSRERDRLDVVELLKVAHFDESYATKLHTCVRETFVECCSRARRELEQESRD